MKNTYFLVCAFLIFTLPAHSQIDTSFTDSYRKYVNDYLNVGADARGIAMSKAVLGTSRDASATYWNPAMLSLNEYRVGFSSMYAEYVGGLSKFNFLAFSRRLNNDKTTLGFSFLRMGTDNIPNTLYLVDDDGNVDYNRVTYFAARDHAYVLSVSQRIGRTDSMTLNHMSIGGNFKFLSRSAGSFAKGWGIGMDLAFTLQRPKSRFSVVIKDATTTFVNWDINFTQEQLTILNGLGNIVPDRSNEIAKPTIMLGFGKTFNLSDKFGWDFEANLINTIDGKRNGSWHLGNIAIDPNFGTELNYNDKIFLRGGIGNFQRQSVLFDSTKVLKTYSPSLGAGVKVGIFGIDYALSKLESTANVPYSHFISVNVRLQGKKTRSIGYYGTKDVDTDNDDTNRINIRK